MKSASLGRLWLVGSVSHCCGCTAFKHRQKCRETGSEMLDVTYQDGKGCRVTLQTLFIKQHLSRFKLRHVTRCALRLRGFCCGEDWVLWFKSYGLTRSYSIASSSSVFGKQIKCETAGRGVRAFAELGDRISRSQLRIRSDTFTHWIPCKGSSYYSQIQPQTQAFRQAAVTLAAGFSSNTSHCLPNF